MPELKDLTVEFISLVAKPANGKPLVLKSQGKPTVFPLAKMDDALMRAYGIVYSPDETDSQGDWATADTIRQAATKFMRQKNQHNVDKEHSYSEEMAFVAETWLVRSQDPLFPDEKDGAWAVGVQVNDPELWKQLKSGELAGLSLAGYARVVDPNSPSYQSKGDEAPGWFGKWVSGWFGKSHYNDKNQQHGTQEADMSLSKEEIAALVGQVVNTAFEKRDAQEETKRKAAEAEAALDEKIKKAVTEGITAVKDDLTKEIAKSLGKGGTESGGGTGESESFLA
jgi:hypothetical protein